MTPVPGALRLAFNAFWIAFIVLALLILRLFAAHKGLGSTMLILIIVAMAIVGAGAAVAMTVVADLFRAHARPELDLRATFKDVLARTQSVVVTALFCAIAAAIITYVVALGATSGTFETYG